MNADVATLYALLRCCVRELAAPSGQLWPAEPYLLIRVGGTLVRAQARGGVALRFDGTPEELHEGMWRPLVTDRLVALVERELGGRNDEFAGQVAASRTVIAGILAARAAAVPPEDAWLESEQSLVLGHPFHPSPKARGEGWLDYAPEAHAAFRLRVLGVRKDLVVQEGEVSALDRWDAPPGYLPLPAHPWQLELLRPPLSDGRLLDLGYGCRVAHPTSSVRTVYADGTCLKFSLNVRITNCVRKNAWYELAGAVALTARLRPAFDALTERFPGTRWLAEPGYRSASLGRRLVEGLGVIVREGPWDVVAPGVTPLLAGALAGSHGRARALLAGYPDPLTWWSAYVDTVALPVLHAYLAHGVVLEPHLQNVLVGVSAEGLPVQAIFRDMEGTKLVAGRHDLSGLAGPVATAMTYDAERGWQRVVYCLIVNHLAEIAASLDASQRSLWAIARDRLAEYASSLVLGPDDALRLANLLAGAPLPAKANLTVRWARSADRAAGYVPVANPLFCQAEIAAARS